MKKRIEKLKRKTQFSLWLHTPNERTTWTFITAARQTKTIEEKLDKQFFKLKFKVIPLWERDYFLLYASKYFHCFTFLSFSIFSILHSLYDFSPILFFSLYYFMEKVPLNELKSSCFFVCESLRKILFLLSLPKVRIRYLILIFTFPPSLSFWWSNEQVSNQEKLLKKNNKRKRLLIYFGFTKFPFCSSVLLIFQTMLFDIVVFKIHSHSFFTY